jgi:hypothetical protein
MKRSSKNAINLQENEVKQELFLSLVLNRLKNSKICVILSEARSALNSKIYITSFSLVSKRKCKFENISLISPKRWLQWLQRCLAGPAGGCKSGCKVVIKSQLIQKHNYTLTRKPQSRVYIPP